MSPIIVVWSVIRPISFRAARIMIGLGLPTLKALTPVATSKVATSAPQPGRIPPFWVGQFGSGFVANQLRSIQNHLHCKLDEFKIEGPSLAHDDVIRIVVHDRNTVLMQGRQQSSFADDECGRGRFLLCQEASGRHGTREDVLFPDIDSQASQFRRNVQSSAATVVGQESERNVPFQELFDKAVRTGNQLRAPIKNPIHVDQITVLCHNESQLPNCSMR